MGTNQGIFWPCVIALWECARAGDLVPRISVRARKAVRVTDRLRLSKIGVTLQRAKKLAEEKPIREPEIDLVVVGITGASLIATKLSPPEVAARIMRTRDVHSLLIDFAAELLTLQLDHIAKSRRKT